MVELDPLLIICVDHLDGYRALWKREGPDAALNRNRKLTELAEGRFGAHFIRG
jgi:hypothetical protein